MHKFIVNNRTRSDPLPLIHHQQASPLPPANNVSSSNGGSGPNLNSVLKLKMTLPSLSSTAHHRLLVHLHKDPNNNQLDYGHNSPSTHVPSSSSSSTASSASSSDNNSPRNNNNNNLRKPKAEPIIKVQATHPNPIRMDGYLKKKRNRVGGGWRKLWFVLQNQLLLSYSSKEDYEKKLAPFKDIINLVPGTVIKPAPGARFTIETTGHVVYTFRCDNNKVCSDWITAICECLGIKSRRRSIPSLTSQKWTLNRTAKRVPKLPMAKNTARILQKGLIHEPIDHIAKVQQDFRLHAADVALGNADQSSAVTRINRMFYVESQEQQPNFHHQKVLNVSRTKKKVSAGREGSPNQRLPRNNSSGGGGALTGRAIIMETLLECDDIEEQMQCITLEDLSLLSQDDNQDSDSVANPLSEYTKTATTAAEEDEPIYAVIDLKEKQKQRQAKLSKQVEDQEIMSPWLYSANIGVTGETTGDDDEEGTAVRSAMEKPPSPGYSFIRGHLSDHNNNTSSHHHYEDGNDGGQLINDNNCASAESGRARMREKRGEDASRLRSDRVTPPPRPKSFQMYSSGCDDYEEVHHFSNMIFSEPNSSADEEEDNDFDEENIYEPINIPDELLSRIHANGSDAAAVTAAAAHKNLWSYFPKINRTIFFDMAKRRHPNNNNNIHTTMSSSSTATTASGSSTSSGASTASVSSFSEMRKKLGSHRRSLKNRVKRMYNRSQTALELQRPPKSHANYGPADEIVHPPSEGNAANTTHSSSSPSPPPLPNVFLPKRERNLFTSLSRLRKSRIPLGRSAPHQRDEVPPSPEQKRMLVSPEKNVCHSKFYDDDGDNNNNNN